MTFDATIRGDYGDDNGSVGHSVKSGGADPASVTGESDAGTEAGSETSMKVVDKEQLFFEVEEALLQLKRKIGSTKKAVSTSLQALICVCHYVIDDLLTMLYPWFDAWEPITLKDRLKTRRKKLKLRKKQAALLPPFTAEEMAAFNAEDEDRAKKQTVARKVRRLTHQTIADMLDPSRIFTDHMLIANYVGTDHVSLTKDASRARFYNTSIAVRSVLGDAGSDDVRRFMKYNEPEYYTHTRRTM